MGHGKPPRLWMRISALLLLAAAALWSATGVVRCVRSGVPASAAVSVDAPADPSPSPSAAAEKLIALTFDDGPSSKNTPRLLDALAERGVHATFFLVGSMVENDPALAVRISLEGHQIGIHTYDHSSSNGLRGLSDAGFDAQVGVTGRMLSELTGQTQFTLRPPYGFVDDGIRARSPGPIILWSVDPEDWKYRDTQHVAQHILSNAQDGSIVLLHDIFSTSVDAAVQVIDTLQADGWRFVTVDELFAARGQQMERGKVYLSACP